MRAIVFVLAMASCATPETLANDVATRRAAVMKYAEALQLTPVAVMCVGREVGPPRRNRCDLRTKEAGVLPLVCTRNDCRLMD